MTDLSNNQGFPIHPSLQQQQMSHCGSKVSVIHLPDDIKSPLPTNRAAAAAVPDFSLWQQREMRLFSHQQQQQQDDLCVITGIAPSFCRQQQQSSNDQKLQQESCSQAAAAAAAAGSAALRSEYRLLEVRDGLCNDLWGQAGFNSNNNMEHLRKQQQPTQLREEDLDFLAEHTDCDRQQLKAQFDNFVAKHPNGSLDRKDFRSIMKTCFPHRDYEALEKRIFNMYDTNRDGLISFREFMVALYIMSSGSPEENLKQIFRVFDVDGDKSITRKEMKKIVSEIHHLLGNENKKELTESAFREMDANNDGRVSEEEFVKAIMAHEKVASMLALKIVQVFDPDRV